MHFGLQEFPEEHWICLKWPTTAHAHPAAQFEGVHALSFSLRENWAAHNFELKEKKLPKLQMWKGRSSKATELLCHMKEQGEAYGLIKSGIAPGF